MRQILSLAIACLLVVSASGCLTANATRVQSCTAYAGGQCTLTLNLNNGDQVSGSVSISGGSGNDVNFYVTDPSGAQIYSAGRVSGGTSFSFTAAAAGGYIIHFDNGFSIFSDKQVTISYDISSTLIPGASSGTSYVIVIVIVVLVVIIILLLRRRQDKEKHLVQPQQSPPPAPTP